MCDVGLCCSCVIKYMSVRLCTIVYDVRSTFVYDCVRLCTRVYVAIHECTREYAFVSVCTSVYACVRVYTLMYMSIRVCTLMYVSVRHTVYGVHCTLKRKTK